MKYSSKFLTALLLCLCMLAGCGGGPEETLPSTQPSTVPSTGQTEPATEPSTEPETEPPVDVESALWAVIDGICPIITEANESVNLAGFLSRDYGAYPASCALVDFDKDGRNEMVVSTTSQDASYIVLHYSEGEVFAYIFGFRSMECLKADGTFVASSGASESSFCHLRFNGGRCIIVCDAKADTDIGLYQIDGEVSTKEAVEDFTKRWYSKPDAYWNYLDMAPEEPTEPVFVSYVQNIPGNQSVYSGPGYDYSFVMSIGIPGTYTIVEETMDYEGNLWGKLKSGAGWINLTDVRNKNACPPMLTVNFANNSEYGTDDYYFIADTSEYAVPVLFLASQPLRYLTLYAVRYDENGMIQREVLYCLDYIDSEKPVVMVLGFPGDMSTYTISFEDSQGEEIYYNLYISGRNGELVMSLLSGS